MLGFPLSQKRHADFCFKPSSLFLFKYDIIDLIIKAALKFISVIIKTESIE